MEIHARGPLAVKAYNKALKEGKVRVKRIPVMLVGQERTGKTSLKKSLKGETFDEREESTDGIEADPSYFKVSTEIWKTGEKMEETDRESSISFEHLAAAKLIIERLRKEEGNLANVSESQVEQPSTSSIHLVSEPTATDTESYHTELPEELTKLLEEMLQKGENAKDDDDIYSILWDFGGQSVYYDTHPIFLTEKAIYILVSDLSRNPNEKAILLVRKGLYRNKVDIYCNKTNLDYLDVWMSSIYSLVSSDVICSKDTATHVHETLPRRLPPVFLVCTHADEPYLTKGACARDLALEIYGRLRSKIYREHLFKDVFVVDNTMSGSDHECPDVMRLREAVLAVAKELPLMKEAIPLKWLRYENMLQIRKKSDKWIPLDEAKRIAFEDCKLDDDEEFSTLLNFLHDQRIVVHFSGSPELEAMVILDPQWLIDVLKKIITVKRYEHSEERLTDLWKKLEDKGILDERLIGHAWKQLFNSHECRNSLLAIMERLCLLCSWPSTDSNKQYLVPSMLMSPPTDNVMTLLDSVKIPSLFVTFESCPVPPGLFSRLILLFFQWCSEEWKSDVSPRLFHNLAMFHILPDQGISVIFLCHSSSIEITVYSGDNDHETTAELTLGNHDMTITRAIHWKLRFILECMRKEFFWLKNMKYDMRVLCPVCSGPGSVKCPAHAMRGCECLHLLSESDLQKCQHCIRPGPDICGDIRIQVKQFACWFSFGDKEGKGVLIIQVSE